MFTILSPNVITLRFSGMIPWTTFLSCRPPILGKVTTLYWLYVNFLVFVECTCNSLSMKIVIWVVWLELQIKRGWACLECWYWEWLLLRCKCICIVKPCLCRERKSFYSLVPIEIAFWCNLSAFTFSVSLPVNDCLWITFCACTHFSFWFACMSRKTKKNPSEWFEDWAKQNKKKTKISQWNSSLWNSSSTRKNRAKQSNLSD